MFNEKLQAGLSFLGDVVALRVMDVYSKYSLRIPVHTKNPQEVWGAFRSSRIGVFGPPMSARMDEGGERKDELWAEIASSATNPIAVSRGWCALLDSRTPQWRGSLFV